MRLFSGSKGTSFPIEATGGGPSAMQPNSLSDARYQTAPGNAPRSLSTGKQAPVY
mgnify:CR=1 FL=1